MGNVIFENAEPFELGIEGLPTAFAEGKKIVLTFPVPIPDQETIALRIPLSIRQTESLALQIQPVLLTARTRARRGL